MPISKRNRRAISVLIILVAIISFAPRLMASASHFSDDDISFEEIKISENELEGRQEYWAAKKSEKYKKGAYTKRYKKPKSKFDPNTYTVEDWKELGLSEKQAMIVVKLSKRGFESNMDLERIYVIPSQVYELLKDSTFYPPPKKPFSYQTNKSTPSKSKVSVNLNGGNYEDFERIPGIGPYYSKKIVDYRNRLGGFVNKEQLLEIWKIDMVKYQEIEEYIYFSAEPVQKISVNKATSAELSAHPYISWQVSNSIVKIREQHGLYLEIGGIKKSKLIDEVTYQKIAPYLSL